MKRATLIIVFCLSVFLPPKTDAKAWRGIVPLRSTRADVVKALGDGMDAKAPGLRYRIDNEDVFLIYSGSNSYLPDCVRQLPSESILAIEVTPNVKLSFDSLGLDAKTFRKVEPTKEAPLRSLGLIDDEQGLVISVNGSVEKLVYVPSKIDRARCPAYYADLSRFVNNTLCILCPQIAVTCPDEIEKGNKIGFTAVVVIGTPAIETTYKWTLTDGTILEGQGTSAITVDASKAKGKTITATVEVGGIDPACANKASCSGPIH